MDSKTRSAAKFWLRWSLLLAALLALGLALAALFRQNGERISVSGSSATAQREDHSLPSASITSSRVTPTPPPATPTPPKQFDGQKAWEDVVFQVNLGARIPGSEAHDKVVEWMVAELERANWQVEIQETEFSGKEIKNVIARRGQGFPWYILGAHYDSRLVADREAEPSKRSQPVPGANDGASGVAVLLELARSLPNDLPGQLWIVLFDLEDNGNLPEYEWIMGSQAFVTQLPGKPDGAIIIDMVGDADQQIYLEGNSDPNLAAQIWEVAERQGYADRFIPELKHTIIDDHLPFIRAGIPAVDIIDFDYPYWHTTQDTADKVSPESLTAVGDTLITWLKETLR